MQIGKFTIGVGDRFGMEAKAQLSAIQKAQALGIPVSPVWNKSNREHTIIGTEPQNVRDEVEAAVKALNYKGEYHVDADHINLKNVDWFLNASDFFTLDVADYIGHAASDSEIQAFLARHQDLIGTLAIPGIDKPLEISPADAKAIAEKTLLAILEAKRLFLHIVEKKGGADSIIIEVSMDETDLPQRPVDMLFILAALADAGIPAQTIAPKFSGRFNKGVDYVGNLAQFEQEFNDDLAVIAYAVDKFSLQKNLKLSVHSGSDKFSIYPIIHRALKRTGAGLHLKTAGTTWLEELIGLAEADGDALALAKEIYATAYNRFDELRKPYATVIDIQWEKLPTPAEVNGWSSQKFCDTLRHDQKCPDYNIHFRQMLHVAFKIAAEKGATYLDMIKKYEAVVAKNVATNLFDRHIRPLFMD